MQVDCNKVKNKKVIRLWDSIEKWAQSDIVNQNIQSPYSAAMSMFESRFQIPMEFAALLSPEQGGPFLTQGNITTFLRDLNSYTQRVSKDKFTSFNAMEGFMTGTMLGKQDPLLQESIKDIRGIVESDSKRTNELNLLFNGIIDQLKASGGLGKGKISKIKLNRALKKHRELEGNHIKALDSGNQKSIDETRLQLEDFENKGSVKTFTEFVKIIENVMPDAIKLKYNQEVELADSGNKEAKSRVARYDDGTLLVRLTDEEYSSILPQVGVPQDLIFATRDYNKLMTESYAQLRNGINKVIDSQLKRIENKPDFVNTKDKLTNIKEKLLSELMPKYKEDGYFPHFVRDLNATMMQGLMKPIDDLTKSNIDMLHERKSIDEIIDNMDLWITNHAKARSQNSDSEYSKNFIDVVNTYIHNVSQFNTTAFLNDSFMNNLLNAKNMYNEKSEYSQKIVDVMNGLYGSVNGDVRNTGSIHEIKKALLAYQFINKLGLSPRAALRNSTQFLMNFATMTSSGVRESMKYLDEKAPLGKINVNDFLQEANLLMDTSEAGLESGITKSSPYKIRRIDENGKIQYVEEGNFAYNGIKIFGKAVGSIAQKTSGMHRWAENKNRIFTAKLAFGQMYKVMNESVPFADYLTKLKSEGKISSFEGEKNRLARNYAKNMVIVNHFDYNSYAKARNMREGVGQFAFQFQHYGMEFLERNWSILKEAKGDLSELPNDSFSNWVKDARGVHKTMNMGVAYFLAPALLSYMSGYNQTLIEHVGVEMLEDMKLLLFSDWDDEEDLEKINREFYGKGIIGSKLGPTFGTLLDVGVATELINADEEYLSNILISTGDFTNDDTMGASAQNIRLLNQFLGRAVDRHLPMSVRTGYGPFSAVAQELTLYPKKQDEPTLWKDAAPMLKTAFPEYYFDKLEKKSKNKKNKYAGLPLRIQGALLKLDEQAGKR
tara:strand:- start:283 stop:3117 length:2835 start_codon:yes stop_codon:yes gene_type:complete